MRNPSRLCVLIIGVASAIEVSVAADPEKEKSKTIPAAQSQSIGSNKAVQVGGTNTVAVGRNAPASIGAAGKRTAGKNTTVTIDAGRTKTVGKNEAVSVGRNRAAQVGADATDKVGAKRTETVGRSGTVSVGGNRPQTVGKNETVTVGDGRAESVGRGASPKPAAKPQPSQKDSQPTTAKPSAGSVRPQRPTVSDDDVMTDLLSKQNALGRGGLAQFANREVRLSPTVTDTLGNLARASFADLDQFRAKTQQIGVRSRAIAAEPIVSDEVAEFSDVFVVKMSTHVIVTDPDSLSRMSPQYARFRKRGGGRATVDKLTPAGRAGLDAYIKNTAPTLPASHPLKEAAAQGPNALLAAISAGKGEFGISRTIIVPKAGFQAVPRDVAAQIEGPVRTIRGTRADAPVAAGPVAAVAGVDEAAIEAALRATLAGIPRVAALRAVEEVKVAAPAKEKVPASGKTGVQVQFRDGKFVQCSPNVGDTGRLNAGADEIGESGITAFAILNRGGNTVSLQSARSGKLVTVRNNQTLWATADALSDAAVFELLPREDPKPQGRGAAAPARARHPRFAIRSARGNRYLAVARDGGLSLTQASPVFTFRFVPSGFRPYVTGQVTMEGSGAPVRDAAIAFRRADGSGEPGRRMTDDRGIYDRYYAEHGTRFIVTPRKEGFLFSPESASVLLDRNHGSLHFRAVQQETLTGTSSFQAEFLAGFSEKKRWEWEERWNFPLGFFRITLGARYNADLRIPIEVRGTMSPADIVYVGDRDKSQRITGRLSVHPVNADANWYRRADVPAGDIHDGKELALGGSILFGLKLNFITDLIHVPNRWHDVLSFKDDFAPPFAGNRSRGMIIEVPPDATGTSIGFRNDVASLVGYAKLGLSLSGEGSRITLRQAGWFDGRPVGDAQPLQFADQENHPARAFDLPLMRNPGTKTYGCRLSRPAYSTTITLTPGVKVGLVAGFAGLSGDFDTDWIWIDFARIALGGMDLGPYKRSASEANIETGRKTFREKR
jgi:hypothetical protein